MGRQNVPLYRREVQSVSRLLGVDLADNPAVVSPERSPHCSNLLRTIPGRVEKRPGFRQTAAYPGAIHGCWQLDGAEILHAGRSLYADGKKVEGELADADSCGFCLGGALWILDGSCLWRLEHHAPQPPVLRPAREIAYCPRIAIGKNPDGSGGTELEDVNLLSDAWEESFYGSADGTVYQLEFGGLNALPVQVRVRRTVGDTVQEHPLTEGVDFSVNRTAGTLAFVQAPGASPIEGEDNVIVRAARDRSALRRRIEQADTGFVYGENGTGLRLIVTGAPELQNRDFWSEPDDPAYFSDLSYSVLGREDSRILGYTMEGSALAAYKSAPEGEVWLRRPVQAVLGDAQGSPRRRLHFTVAEVVPGCEAAARHSFAMLNGEALFLTGQGICALALSDSGSRYSRQRRSYFIDPLLTVQPGLDRASAAVWKDFYLLAAGGRIFCLDGLQKSYAREAPKSTFQYECYLLEDIPAAKLWVRDGRLWFGTGDGRVCVLNEGSALTDYMDCLEGLPPRPVHAVWETPDLAGSCFYRDKTFRWLTAQVLPAAATSVRMSAAREGVWRALHSGSFQVRHFAFGQLMFSRLNFSGDATSQPIGLSLHLHRLDKVRFRFENGEACEPFGLMGWAMEYTAGRRHRR